MEASGIFINIWVLRADRCNESFKKTVSGVYGWIFKDMHVHKTLICSINKYDFELHQGRVTLLVIHCVVFLIRSYQYVFPRSFKNDPSPINQVSHPQEVLVMLFWRQWTGDILLLTTIIPFHWVKTWWRYFLLSCFHDFLAMQFTSWG